MEVPQGKAKLDENAAALMQEYGVTCKTYTVEIEKEEQVKAAADQIEKDFGKIDGLLNVAGINYYGTVDEYTEDDYQRLFAVNVAGTFACCKYFGRKMRDRKQGSIVNIASVSGTIANRAPGPVSAYCTTKAALIHMSRAIAAEFGADNVRVNTLSPGWMEVRMTYTGGNRSVDPEFNKSIMVDGTPMNRYAKADELVGGAIYLLSDASSFTTGIDLLIDGGFHCW